MEPRRTMCATAQAHGLQETAHKQCCHAASALCHGSGGHTQVFCSSRPCTSFPRVLCDTANASSHAMT